MSGFRLKRNYFLLVILLAFLVFMTFLLGGSKSDMLQYEPPVSYNSGWNVQDDADCETVLLKRTVSADMLGNVLCFYAYDSYVDADINGTLIYSFGEEHLFLKSPGSLWHMISIPADSLGKELSIKIRTVYKYKYTTDFDIEMGSSGAIILRRLSAESLDLFVNLAVLILGVVLCTIFFLQFKNKIYNSSSLLLGLLSLCFVFWTNNNMFFAQLVFPYGAGQYFTYYFCLFMLPLLMICYLETITDKLKFNYLFWSHITLGTVLSILQISGTAEFTETVTVFLIFTGLEMLLVVIRLLLNRGSHRNRLLVYAFVAMVCCILVNAGMFFINPVKGVSTAITKVGICLYLLVSIYVSLSSIINDLAEAKQSKVLRRIAFTDSLTGVGNRYAFNDEINNVQLTALSLVSIDINNLKYYNDTYGHACGDTLICDAADMLGNVFGKLYRIGGDEFVAAEFNTTQEELFQMKQKLESLMREHNKSDPEVLVEIACGYSSFQPGDVSYEDILRRADAEMYKDKTEIKSRSKIKFIR